MQHTTSRIEKDVGILKHKTSHIESPEICKGVKKATIAAHSGWQTLITHAGSGTVKKLWMACAAYKDQLFFNIKFDGAITPQFGTQNNPPSLYGDLTVDAFLTRSLALPNTYTSEHFGCTTDDGISRAGGYLAIDMPFSKGFSMAVYNSSSSNGDISVMFYIDPSPPIIPRTLCCKVLNISDLNYPTEYPLMSVASSSGVTLKCVKIFLTNCADNWLGGTFRIYTDSTPLSTPVNTNHWDNTQTPTPLTPQGSVIAHSTDTVGYFLSSFEGINNSEDGLYPPVVSDETLYNTAYPTHGGVLLVRRVVGSTPPSLDFVGQRVYTETAPQSAPKEYLTLTYSPGTLIAGPGTNAGAGSVTRMFGQIYYYI